jgi:2,3-bisphosphoglycerate-independent phosphoglycerate mutase
MKTLFIILDGAADRRCKELNGKTPLEAASTPNLDWLAQNGKQAIVKIIEGNTTPESNEAIMTLLGYPSRIIARGVLEALGSGIKLKHGDLALRTNFATITSIHEPIIIDRRAGRTLTTKEANILAKEINKKLKLPYKFIFKSTVQHRGVLVIKGGFSDNITNIDRAYLKSRNKNRLKYSVALDDDETSELSANIVNEFVEQSYFILKNHPINQLRLKKNLLPANIILVRDAGNDVPEIRKLPGKWASVVSMPLEKGIAKVTGMYIFSFNYPALKNADIYENLYLGLRTTISVANKCIERNLKRYDYFYIHFKETDLPGHDGKPEEKKRMIELIDREFFSLIKRILEKLKIKAVITVDHATPCSIKLHAPDPVPLLVYGNGRDDTKRFTEAESKRGSLGKLSGKEVIGIITG